MTKVLNTTEKEQAKRDLKVYAWATINRPMSKAEREAFVITFRDEEFRNKYLLSNISALEIVEQTTELCETLVRHNAEAIQYVNEPSRELLALAVSLDGDTLRHGRQYWPQLLDEAICLAAVKNAGLALQFVPEQFRTDAVCLGALRQDKTATIFMAPDHARQLLVKLGHSGDERFAWEGMTKNEFIAARSLVRFAAMGVMPSRERLEATRAVLHRYECNCDSEARQIAEAVSYIDAIAAGKLPSKLEVIQAEALFEEIRDGLIPF